MRIRRMALVCAGALAIVPLTAGPATAQSPEDLEELLDPGQLEELLDLADEADEDDEDDEDGDEGEGTTGTPLDALLDPLSEILDPGQLEELCEMAPEELEALFGPICDVIAGDDEEAPEDEEIEEEPLADPGEPEPEDPAPLDTTDPDPGGELPRTGGMAGLLGLGLLGAGAALRRGRGTDVA